MATNTVAHSNAMEMLVGCIICKLIGPKITLALVDHRPLHFI